MAKFLLDENLPNSAVKVFKTHGLDAVHVRLQGLKGLSDPDLLKIAKTEGRILVTRDLGFGNLLDYPFTSHHGIVILRLPDTYTAKQVNKAIEDFIIGIASSEVEEALVTVEPGRCRIRRKS